MCSKCIQALEVIISLALAAVGQVVEKTDIHMFWSSSSEKKTWVTEDIFLWQYLCALMSASIHTHTHKHTAHLHLPTATPNQGLHGTAYPVSGGGNMSVPAEDELLWQSLEQSLCPNEEDSTDSTPTYPPPPPWAWAPDA